MEEQVGILGSSISAQLLQDVPDIAGVVSQIGSEYGLPTDDAKEVFRDIVFDLNRKLFIPLKKVELILVEGCNLACTYCFESKFLNTEYLRRRLMDGPVIHKALDMLFRYSGGRKDLEVTLFGGEPTLNMPGIREAVSYANKLAVKSGKNVKFDMTSNGVLFTPEIVRYFADSRIMVLLSIDGTKSAHDAYRVDKKGNGTFDAVLRGMDLLKEVQPWVGTKMTVMPAVAGQLFKSIEYLYQRGINQFVIGHATGEAWTPEALAKYARNMEVTKQWYRALVEQDAPIRISQFDEDGEHSCGGFFGCGAGRDTVAVEASGKITGCSRIATIEDHTYTGLLGDVEYGLYCLKTRKEMSGCSTLYNNCKSEGIEKEYRGGCFATNYEETGSLFKPNIKEHEISIRINTANG